jgi:hypothetical protein
MTALSVVAGVYMGFVHGSIAEDDWWHLERNIGRAFFYSSAGSICDGSIEKNKSLRHFEMQEVMV